MYFLYTYESLLKIEKNKLYSLYIPDIFLESENHLLLATAEKKDDVISLAEKELSSRIIEWLIKGNDIPSQNQIERDIVPQDVEVIELAPLIEAPRSVWLSYRKKRDHIHITHVFEEYDEPNNNGDWDISSDIDYDYLMDILDRSNKDDYKYIEGYGEPNSNGDWDVSIDMGSDNLMDIFKDYCITNNRYPNYPFLFTVGSKEEAKSKFLELVKEIFDEKI